MYTRYCSRVHRFPWRGVRVLDCWNLRLIGVLKMSYAGCSGLTLMISVQFTLEVGVTARNRINESVKPFFAVQGHLKSLLSVPNESACTTYYYRLIVILAFSHAVFETRRLGAYWLKIVNFFTPPPLFSSLGWDDPVRIFRKALPIPKLESFTKLRWKFRDVACTVLIQSQSVTDGPAEG